MGRYITGDIETKLWFGVQPSDAADRFGVEGIRPEELNYYYTKNDLEEVEIELDTIANILGEHLVTLNNFFNSTEGYNKTIMEEYQEGLSDIWDKHKADYADYTLGIKIRDCIKNQGSCDFTAEM